MVGSGLSAGSWLSSQQELGSTHLLLKQ